MTRFLRVLVCSVVLITIVAAWSAPAGAGGSEWRFDRERYRPGDTAFVWAPIAWEHNPTLGTPQDGPYHAYLAPYRPDATSLDRSGTPVGDLTVSLEPYGTAPARFGPHHAELTFTVPQLPPGQYQLLHANDAGKPVGDLVGLSPIWIDAPMVRAAPTFTG